MKTAYSTYQTKIWRQFKQFFPCRSEYDYCRMASELWGWALSKSVQSGKGVNWDRDSIYTENMINFLWFFRRVDHYFLAPGVAEFCVSSVKEFTHDYCKRLPECSPVDYPCDREKWFFAASLAYFQKGSIDKVQGGFAIHFPAKERQRSVIVIPDAFLPVPSFYFPNNDKPGYIHYYFMAADGEDVLLMQPLSHNEEFGSDDNTRWLAKLVFGLSLYMDAFPDTVVEAGVESIHQVKRYTGVRHTVNRNEIVNEEHRHSVSPHWRRGHFRLLTSAKFVRKHGQTVFVRGTFVKGKAFDVMSDTPSCTVKEEKT